MTMRKLVLGLAATALLTVAVAFATGSVALVTTYGNSMAPRITAGDLVVVRDSSSYAVGDVVAYSSADLHRVILHRVVSVDGGRYTFRGDHNDFNDPERPTTKQLIGTDLLRIPQGGIWLHRLTQPIALGLLAFVLLAGGGTAVQTRRRRRRRTMAQHSAPAPRRSRVGLTELASRLRAGAVIALAVTSVLLGALAWTRQPPEPTVVTDEATMTFSYHATVPASPAYSGTTVTSPDPLFRRLVDTAEVQYSYQGRPGSISVAAELSTASGWHTTLPLQPAVMFDHARYAGTVPLHLNALEARAQAAAEAIGIPATQLEVTIVASVTTRDGEIFAPRLPLTLTALQLALVGDKSALTVNDSRPRDRLDASGHAFNVLGHQMSASTLRIASSILTLGGLLTLCFLGLMRRFTPTDEGAAIRRQYASILLHIEPVTSPPGRPVVDVVDFPALAKLAERYGLLVLHWARSNVETFIVQDDGITYRYRTGTAHPPGTPNPNSDLAADHPPTELEQTATATPSAGGPDNT
jgi:signal peptidase I